MNSESQILSSVEELRHLVQVLVWIGAIGAAALVVRMFIEAYATWRQIKKEGFEGLASGLYREGKLDQIVIICRERLESHATDPYPHFYLGIVAFDQKRDAEAREHFDKTLALAPTWQSVVSGYLKRIDERAAANPSGETQ